MTNRKNQTELGYWPVEHRDIETVATSLQIFHLHIPPESEMLVIGEGVLQKTKYYEQKITLGVIGEEDTLTSTCKLSFREFTPDYFRYFYTLGNDFRLEEPRTEPTSAGEFPDCYLYGEAQGEEIIQLRRSGSVERPIDTAIFWEGGDRFKIEASLSTEVFNTLVDILKRDRLSSLRYKIHSNDLLFRAETPMTTGMTEYFIRKPENEGLVAYGHCCGCYIYEKDVFGF